MKGLELNGALAANDIFNNSNSNAILKNLSVRHLFFYFVIFAIPVLAITGMLRLVSPMLLDAFQQPLLSAFVSSLSDEQREELYERTVSASPGAWDTVPEPLVARLGQRGKTVHMKQVDVGFNNAGMRNRKHYTEKDSDTFRIICLGDSFVLGEGGKEEDRFCDQLGRFYVKEGISAGDKKIETYALGLGSWSARQSATYLTSRLSAYDPDVIIVLNVENDISSNLGVTGTGTITSGFSPEAREWGNGVFHNRAPSAFGGGVSYSVSSFYITDAGKRQWHQAMHSLERLVDLQHARGGKILLAHLEGYDWFFETYRWWLDEHNVEVPVLKMDSFRRDGDFTLPHDGHPNRRGHKILSNHLVHTLDKLGWVNVPGKDLPELKEGLSVNTDVRGDWNSVERANQKFISNHLGTSLNFQRISKTHLRSLLGGIFPKEKAETLSEAPWAAPRSGFVLKSPPGADMIRIAIEVPARVELYPFELDVAIDGQFERKLFLPEISDGGQHSIEIPLDQERAADQPIEIVMKAGSYFTTITDHRMKSFRLVEAELVKSGR